MSFLYFKLAMRNFRKDRIYAIVNLLGFTLGLTACLLIILYVSDELSYDRHHEKADQIYRLEWDRNQGTETKRSLHLPTALGPELERKIPEIASQSVFYTSKTDFDFEGKTIPLKSGYMTPKGLDIFTFTFIQGDKETAFDEPKEVLISRKVAEQFYPNKNPLGEEISRKFRGSLDTYKIGGVIENIPKQSHFQFDVLISREEESRALDFGAYSGQSQYVLLTPNAQPDSVIAKFMAISADYNYPEDATLRLRPLTSIHLYSHTQNELEANGSITYVTTFSLSAILLLLLACINFINLLTARSLRRAKEVGIRKTLGAIRKQLAMQFFGESFFYVFLAVGLAIVCAEVLLPFFNTLLQKELAMGSLWSSLGWIFFLVILLTGVLSGLYPALYLSSFRPAFALQHVIKGSKREHGIRKGLLVFQFMISIGLIICTLSIYRQMNFVGGKNLGFETENLLILPPTQLTGAETEPFRQDLLKIAGINHVSFATWSPGNPIGNISSTMDSTMTAPLAMRFLSTDGSFASTAGLKVLSGNFISEDYAPPKIERGISFDDEGNVIYSEAELQQHLVLNETAVKVLGLEDPVGKIVERNIIRGKVIGVVEDFHEQSLHHEIGAVAIQRRDPFFSHTLIRLEEASTLLPRIESVWKQHLPDQSFAFEFAEDQLQTLYVQEKQLGQLFLTFAILAIIVANLGLIGIIAFAVEQKTKEIGIRKILGATVAQIVQLFSRDFVWMILIAFLLISPVVWYLIDSWLQSFAYKTEISVWIFLSAGVGTIVLALLMVSFQSIRAATANPIDALRTE